MTTTTFTIDCDTCPGRGRLCGDCFVPVLGKVWLQDPPVRQAEGPAESAPHQPGGPAHHVGRIGQDTGERTERSRTVPLDTDELAAVSAFVRAGLVDPEEAAAARAELTGSARSAAG